jgi:hypothetical protein
LLFCCRSSAFSLSPRDKYFLVGHTFIDRVAPAEQYISHSSKQVPGLVMLLEEADNTEKVFCHADNKNNNALRQMSLTNEMDIDFRL